VMHFHYFIRPEVESGMRYWCIYTISWNWTLNLEWDTGAFSPFHQTRGLLWYVVHASKRISMHFHYFIKLCYQISSERTWFHLVYPVIISSLAHHFFFLVHFQTSRTISKSSIMLCDFHMRMELVSFLDRPVFLCSKICDRFFEWVNVLDECLLEI
jgi:hypothetical protein